MLTNLKTILDVAYANKYAVGSFNGYNSETFRGIIEAGKETNTPIIWFYVDSYFVLSVMRMLFHSLSLL